MGPVGESRIHEEDFLIGSGLMKLYWGLHTCAIGTHILLEETGGAYETQQLDVGAGDSGMPALMAINPKGKVPALVRDDGSVLTEFGAIATWLARKFPNAGLLPADPDSEARVIEVMDYVVGTVHGQGFGRIFKPARFEPQDMLHGKVGLGHSSVERQGREMVDKAFGILNTQLLGKEYVAGSQFSIADAALFYVERWAAQKEIPLPANLQGHFERMLTRPSVRKVRTIWKET